MSTAFSRSPGQPRQYVQDAIHDHARRRLGPARAGRARLRLRQRQHDCAGRTIGAHRHPPSADRRRRWPRVTHGWPTSAPTTDMSRTFGAVRRLNAKASVPAMSILSSSPGETVATPALSRAWRGDDQRGQKPFGGHGSVLPAGPGVPMARSMIGSSHVSPRQASTPSRTATAAITSPATGSAQLQPNQSVQQQTDQQHRRQIGAQHGLFRVRDQISTVGWPLAPLRLIYRGPAEGRITAGASAR